MLLMLLLLLLLMLLGSPEEASAEFKLMGGLAISGTNRANHSSQSLLAWNTSRKHGHSGSPVKRSSASTGSGSGSAVDSNDGFVHPADSLYSKTPTKEDDRGFLFGNYKWSSTKTAHLAKPSPYDVDQEANPFQKLVSTPTSSSKRGSTTPRSLSDVLQSSQQQQQQQESPSQHQISSGSSKKQQPTSLLDLVNSRR